MTLRGNSELAEISPGSATDALSNGFTMKSEIAGSQFMTMTNVDISIDGYLVDADAGSDPGTVWAMIE